MPCRYKHPSVFCRSFHFQLPSSSYLLFVSYRNEQNMSIFVLLQFVSYRNFFLSRPLHPNTSLQRISVMKFLCVSKKRIFLISISCSSFLSSLICVVITPRFFPSFFTIFLRFKFHLPTSEYSKRMVFTNEFLQKIPMIFFISRFFAIISFLCAWNFQYSSIHSHFGNIDLFHHGKFQCPHF